MSPRRLALARFLIRRYPHRWRERYADEVLAMIEEAGVTPLGLFDLARGAVGEQVRLAYSRAFGAPSARVILIGQSIAHALVVTAAGIGLWSLGLWIGDSLAARGVRITSSTWFWMTLPMGIGMLRTGAILAIGAMYGARGQAIPPTAVGVGRIELVLWLLTVPLNIVGHILHDGGLLVALGNDHVVLARFLLFFTILSLTSRTRLAAENRLREILMKPGPQTVVYSRPILGLSEPDDAR